VIIFTSDLVLNQLRIVTKFNMISILAAQTQEEEAADLWVDAAAIRKKANEILSLLSTIPEEEVDVQDR